MRFVDGNFRGEDDQERLILAKAEADGIVPDRDYYGPGRKCNLGEFGQETLHYGPAVFRGLLRIACSASRDNAAAARCLAQLAPHLFESKKDWHS